MSRRANLDSGSLLIQPGSFNSYLLTLAFVVVAAVLCLALIPANPVVVIAPLLVAVVAASAVCGIRAGILALVLTSFAAAWYLLPPGLPHGWPTGWDSVRHGGTLLAFIGTASVVAGITGALRLILARSRRAARPLRMFFEAQREAILLTDANGKITDANPWAAELFGKSAGALNGISFETLFPERLRARVAALRGTPRAEAMNLFITRDDGAEFPVDVSTRTAKIDGAEHVIVTVRDHDAPWAPPAGTPAPITAAAVRPHSAEEIRLWADAFTHAAVGLTITDPVTRSLRFVNKTWADMHGWDANEVAGMPTALFFPEDELPRLASIYAEADRKGHVTFEVRRKRKDGTTFLAAFDVVTVQDDAGKPLYRVATSRDITAAKQAEELLRHATKMEAIGGLTGGMAHDFNNLLGAIILSLDFVKSEMSDDDHLKPFVIEAKSAAESGAELIRNLLSFARRQTLRPTRIDVNEQVAGMHRLLSRVLGEEIAIELKTAPDLWPVIADRSQLEACLFNLATNARDAMPKGGSLTIVTSNQHLDDEYVKQNPSVTPGDYVLIAVSDTGIGMSPDVMAKVFEPFFTTKEIGSGTGLGLSMVFGFATQSGGHVSVSSEVDVGTTMRLYLPRARLLAGAGPAEGAKPPVPVAKGDGETILVVEDNTVMRRVVVRQLSQLNYTVYEVDNAPAAMEMLEDGIVDLLFSDIVMPNGMDGFELAERVRARWSSVKVLLTSGFTGDQASRRSGDVRTTARLLGKPYDLEELARAVREALNG